jgi:flagellin
MPYDLCVKAREALQKMMINNYVQSLHILNLMNVNQTMFQRHLLHIASGRRILGPADDPSGYAIGRRMDIRIRSLDAASANAQRGISMLKTAEGAVNSTVDILRTLKEKVLSAANGTASDADRRIVQKELNEFVDQIDDNALVNYNGRYLMDGSQTRQMQSTTEAFTNRSLNAKTTAATALTNLSRRDGDALNITSSDQVTVSFVKQGQTYTTSFIAGTNTLQDIFSKANHLSPGNVFNSSLSSGPSIGIDANGQTIYTPDGTSAITVKAAGAGKDAAVSGFSISVSDNTGKVKKSANAVLDAFSETIQAADKKNDSALILQTGASANQNISVAFGDMRAQSLGLKGTNGKILNVSNQASANAALSVLDNALAKALDEETSIGAAQNRLTYTVKNLTTESENLTAAMSTILDADMAREITELMKYNVLNQAAQMMLAQSNQNIGWFLSLLR